MSTLTINKSNCANELWFSKDRMYVLLEDGRELAVPIDWFPALRDASDEQRNHFRFIGSGEGIHWETLDLDILVEGLL